MKRVIAIPGRTFHADNAGDKRCVDCEHSRQYRKGNREHPWVYDCAEGLKPGPDGERDPICIENEVP